MFARTRCAPRRIARTWGQPALDYVTSFLASWLLSKVTVPQHCRIVVNWTDAEVINAQEITLRAFRRRREMISSASSGTTVTWQSTAGEPGVSAGEGGVQRIAAGTFHPPKTRPADASVFVSTQMLRAGTQGSYRGLCESRWPIRRTANSHLHPPSGADKCMQQEGLRNCKN